MSKTQALLKRLVVGRPMSSGELEHTLLPKRIALPLFASDALSSVAYATQEITIVLGLVGASALDLVTPISVAVAALLAIVVTSYRQTVRAYPQGGGAYRVAHDNLGVYPGIFAASALLIDYVLTVAVSITAGADAVTTAVDGLEPFRVQIAIGFIAFITFMNLRGIKESGTLFAIPTYGFILSVMVLLGTGLVRCAGGCPPAESAGLELHTTETLTLFLILRAYTAGTSALTGVEAIADGVPAFRFPQSRNAAKTLAIMGSIAITMFLGISLLANGTGVRYEEGVANQKTVLGQIANAIFDGGPMFYVLQVMTAAILVLAANTAYADFPRLSSILAQDHFMPRQLMNRGDRLVFSNGIIALALLASVLIWVFDADLNRLIQLYLVGVFVSFTLSQTGMVVRWRKQRTKGWQRSVLIQGFGATVTAIVLCVVVATKFTRGAWIVVAAQPILMYFLLSVHRHYKDVAQALADETRRPRDRRAGHQHMVILVRAVDIACARAVGYVRSVRPAEITAVAFDESLKPAWTELAGDIPLEIATPQGSTSRSLRRFLRHKRERYGEDDFLTLVMPETLKSHNIMEIIRRPALHRIKASLLLEPGVQVLDLPVFRDDTSHDVDPVTEPTHNHICVLVSGVHNATLQAIEYAETLSASSIRCVTFGLDEAAAAQLGGKWLDARIPHPLEIEDSPFRDIGLSLLRYIRRWHSDGVNRVVTVVIPEFVVSKRRHQLLHGQTALIAKRHLLFEEGVVVVSVPYYLGESKASTSRART